MTAIPFWEAALLAIVVAILLIGGFAVFFVFMGLRNSRTAALVKAHHDSKTKELEASNDKLTRRIAELEIQVRILMELLATNRALTPADVDLLHNVSQTNSRLLMAMQLSFNEEELQVLSFELGLNFGNVAGTTLDAKIVNLISLVQRTGRLPDLMKKVKELRPQLHLEAMS